MYLFMKPYAWTSPRAALLSDFAGSSFSLILQVLMTLTVCLFVLNGFLSLFYALMRLSGSGLDSPSLKPAAAFAHQSDSSRWREIQCLLCLFLSSFLMPPTEPMFPDAGTDWVSIKSVLNQKRGCGRQPYVDNCQVTFWNYNCNDFAPN